MKLTITTLVIIEDTSDNCNELNLCYHSKVNLTDITIIDIISLP